MDTGGPARRVIDDRFELVGRLGGGGMGVVWRARDLTLHRDVAVKEVRPPDPGLAEYDPEAARHLRERVLREARALARVHHPNVATIHHIVDDGEGTYPWIVMELVTGGSLQNRLDKGPLTPGEAARTGREVLAGLRAVHAAGIEHRDVKPANILLRPDGRPVLTDFGIAAGQEFTSLTATGSIIGSPDFMAPERVAGRDGGPAADLWSLAMTLYVAVEGHHPMRRGNTLATLAAVLGEDVPPPRFAGPLTGLLTALLVRDPEARPDAEAVDRMLAAVAEGKGAATAAAAVSTTTATSYRLPPPAAPPAAEPGAGGAAQAPTRPPAGPGAQRRRRVPGLRALAVTAAFAGTVLSGAALWNLLPDSGGDGDDSGAGPRGRVTAAPSPSTTSGGSPAGEPVNADDAGDNDDAGNGDEAADLLTPEGIRTAVAELEKVMGGTTVTQLAIYEEYAIAQAPVKGDKKLYDRFTYRAGSDAAVHDGAGGTITDGTVPVDLGEYDWDAVPGLLRRAERTLGVEKPTMRYVLVSPASTVFDTGPSMNVYLTDDYGGAYLKATPEGEVVATYPRENG
ncbi:serine/threonine protein kinase [Streptomyces carminius]|uniref:non-specific serine/threonine protein kinase n=1 Tax=Streptomyces carminius TaxID=2665496 RepID=A0A2M8LZP5_9ACTN|nr:serine/threonine-protein kinase [Streptomyces carminius]PJE97410.1 serine/threonine protein kinase [Streptomyces carminius]